MSAFCYCPLIWMFHGKSANKVLNKAHCRALSVVYMKYDDTFENLLSIDNNVSIHIRNMQYLMIEVYKCIHKLNPTFMWQLFKIKSIPYNLRIGGLIELPTSKTKSYGINAFMFRGSILWNSVPNELKDAKTINIFKTSIKKWTGNLCKCRICCT